jgi:hypothetical protein
MKQPSARHAALACLRVSYCADHLVLKSGYTVLKPTKASDHLAGTEPASYNHQKSKKVFDVQNDTGLVGRS